MDAYRDFTGYKYIYICMFSGQFLPISYNISGTDLDIGGFGEYSKSVGELQAQTSSKIIPLN